MYVYILASLPAPKRSFTRIRDVVCLWVIEGIYINMFFDLLDSTVPRRLLEQQYPQHDIIRKVKMKNINTPQISMFDLLISYKSSTVL